MQKWLLIIIFTILELSVYAQKDTIPIPVIPKDTISLINDSITRSKPVIKVSHDSIQALTRNALKSSLQKNLEEFEKDKMIARQDKFFAELGIALDNTSEYLKRGIDTARLDIEIANIVKWYKIAADGVFINTGTAQTSRNLTITHIILTESNKRLELRFEEINKYLNELSGQKKVLDSLLSDSTLLNFPKDSVAFDNFFTKAVRTGTELRTVYRNLKGVMSTIQDLNAKFLVVHNTLKIKLDEVEQYRINLSKQGFKREFSNIWGPIGYTRPLKEILELSVNKNIIVLGFYLANHLSYILVLALLTMILALFLRYLKKSAETRLETQLDSNLQFVLNNSGLISTFIMLNVSQFFFNNPPFIFYASGWLFSCLILTILFWRKISSSLRVPWVMLVFMFVATSVLNSVLQASRVERWMMLAMAIFILVSAIFSAKRLLRREGNNRFLLIFVGIVVVMETLSVFLNIFGRYNMSKIALTSGIFNLVVVVLLLWASFYINEIIKIIARIFNLNAANENSEPIEAAPKDLPRFPAFLNILLLVGWFILFMRNFYAFTVFTEPFRDFMETERALGAYTFSIQSIANFFLIMLTATLLSKVISFFASDAHQNSGVGKKGLGSWLLLVRISIFSIAMFLAFAATGIAMDRIAIIFSALSVGIGFGLQTLVNNLVSGLIIAFEKPVNVGDAVDINGQSGTMKSIGFRSSVINTYDGSDIIIPNGDLLNAHLINWTLGDTKRRVEILVGVAYGTDLEKVKTILLNILEDEERILKFPGPTILVKEFASSSIDFRVLFWIDSAYNLWTIVKSDVLRQIDISFKKEGIEIPFAQQDINIRSVSLTRLPNDIETKEALKPDLQPEPELKPGQEQ
jgi:small-conductance mechanosensitive channel